MKRFVLSFVVAAGLAFGFAQEVKAQYTLAGEETNDTSVSSLVAGALTDYSTAATLLGGCINVTTDGGKNTPGGNGTQYVQGCLDFAKANGGISSTLYNALTAANNDADTNYKAAVDAMYGLYGATYYAKSDRDWMNAYLFAAQTSLGKAKDGGGDSDQGDLGDADTAYNLAEGYSLYTEGDLDTVTTGCNGAKSEWNYILSQIPGAASID